MSGLKLDIPGFVDLQVNGFLGVDFSSPDLTEESFVSACRELLKRGTAAFLPTMITSPVKVYRRNLPLIAKAMTETEFRGRLLGIHLEGPFISPAPGAVGAHNPEWVREPSIGFFDELQDWAQGKIRLMTIAADVSGAEELTRHAVAHGTVVSLGHHLALDADLERLAQVGATALTHLGNGIPNLLPRHPNPIWDGLANDHLHVMLIADGHHLPASFIKAAIRAKGIPNISVVSDAAPLAGLPPGRYRIWQTEVVLEESGLLHDPVKGNLAGSSAIMLDCMNHLVSLGFLSLDDLLNLGFYNPLRLIGVEPPRIQAGPSVIFDESTASFHIEPLE